MSVTVDQISITNIPDNIKAWKPLSGYNRSWEFISYENRYRITEALAGIDYFISIYNWLKPAFTFADVHKRMILMLVSGIYECVLSDAVSRTAKQELVESKILKQFVSKDRIQEIDKDEFEKLINNGEIIGMYGSDWKEYLHKIREVRNWIHLAKARDTNLGDWLGLQTIDTLKNKLDEFRILSEAYFSKIYIQ